MSESSTQPGSGRPRILVARRVPPAVAERAQREFDAILAEHDMDAAEVMRVKISRLRRKIEPNPAQPRFLHSQRGTGYLLEDRADAVAPED